MASQENNYNPQHADSFGAMDKVSKTNAARYLAYSLGIIALLTLPCLLLPWTQSIESKGKLTALLPEQRPQTINSTIAGSIAKWYVRDGQMVKQGDTLIFLAEVKDQYIDPLLLNRIDAQVNAKKSSIASYQSKIESLDNQIRALKNSLQLKLEQTRNKLQQVKLKVISDSTDLRAVANQQDVAQKQFERQEKLHKQGLKSLTELEAYSVKLQDASAKLISAQNKLLVSRNELLNAQIELNAVENEYREKYSKAESDQNSARSDLFTSEADLEKLMNQFMNYSIRRNFYYITAPQDGYVTLNLSAGIGEVVKEGQAVATIVPAKAQMAAELYVDPADVTLIQRGEKVRLRFDGWPSVVFSGWPGVSFGTFGGTVYAIDNSIHDNGKYRLLIAPDSTDDKWPEQLRQGSGVLGWTLLRDVPIGYEMWRRLNGFPPEFYQNETGKEKPKKK